MNNTMVMILFFLLILCIQSVFGMDNFSDDLDSNNTEEIDLTEYTKEKLQVDASYDDHKNISHSEKNLVNPNNVQKYQTEENFGVKNFYQDFEKNSDETNKLKRKHKSILECELCHKKSTQCKTGQVSGKSLCSACYMCEYQRGHLIAPSERNKQKHNHKLLCEFCQEKKPNISSKLSGKSLCPACYQFENKHTYLLPRNERNRRSIHKNILVCQCCQKESKKYATGKVSGKSLCLTCYSFEHTHNYLLPPEERKNNGHNKPKIFRCEYCEEESSRYRKSKISGLSLCNACKLYENKHGQLIPRNERKQLNMHKNILVCDFCQEKSNIYLKSKIDGKSLCGTCYNYENKHGKLIPRDQRKGRHLHKNILVCDFCQEESSKYKKSRINGESLCQPCYDYENYHGKLIPRDEREKLKNILVCDFCDFCEEKSSVYKQSKVNGKSLCHACYRYEYKHGQLIPRDERKKRYNVIHKNNNNEMNCLIDSEKFKIEQKSSTKEETLIKKYDKTVTKQRNENDEDSKNIVQKKYDN